MYAIQIEKKTIPYKTNVVINGELFKLGFNYNIYDNRVYCSLYEFNDNVLVEDDPIVFGQILFGRYYMDNAKNFRKDFPKALLIPNFIDGNRVEEITYDNIESCAIYVEEIK